MAGCLQPSSPPFGLVSAAFSLLMLTRLTFYWSLPGWIELYCGPYWSRSKLYQNHWTFISKNNGGWNGRKSGRPLSSRHRFQGQPDVFLFLPWAAGRQTWNRRSLQRSQKSCVELKNWKKQKWETENTGQLEVLKCFGAPTLWNTSYQSLAAAGFIIMLNMHNIRISKDQRFQTLCIKNHGAEAQNSGEKIKPKLQKTAAKSEGKKECRYIWLKRELKRERALLWRRISCGLILGRGPYVCPHYWRWQLRNTSVMYRGGDIQVVIVIFQQFPWKRF